MFSTSPVDELIARASSLTSDELAELARVTRKAIGFGLSAYLGLRHSSLTANATAAISRAGREEEMRTTAPLVQEAVLTAAIAAATMAGRDTSRVQQAWQEFQRAVDSGDARQRQRAFRSAQKAFRRGLGPRLTRQWPMAGMGASWALMVIVTWDLVTQEGPYTIHDRETLVRPWTTVAALPQIPD